MDNLKDEGEENEDAEMIRSTLDLRQVGDPKKAKVTGPVLRDLAHCLIDDEEDGPLLSISSGDTIFPEESTEKIVVLKGEVRDALEALMILYKGHEGLALAIDAALHAAFQAGQKARGV